MGAAIIPNIGVVKEYVVDRDSVIAVLKYRANREGGTYLTVSIFE